MFLQTCFFLVLAFLSTAQRVEALTIDDGLAAYYPFDGTAEDWSGNRNDGTVHGAAPAPDRFGNPGHAFRFDGMNDYISVGDSPTLDITGEITISVWARMEAAGNPLPIPQYLISRGTGIAEDAIRNTYSLYLGDPIFFRSLTVELSDGSVRTYTPDVPGLRLTGFDSETWHHLAATWDGALIRVFLDGIHVSGADTAFTGPINSLSAPLSIGKLGYGSGNNFKGDLDDIRIYDRALSAAEIQNLFLGRLDCDTEARYTEEDLQQAYRNGYDDGYSDAAAGGGDSCAAFDVSTTMLHIPCIGFGSEETYRADLLLLPTDPVRLELRDFGRN